MFHTYFWISDIVIYIQGISQKKPPKVFGHISHYPNVLFNIFFTSLNHYPCNKNCMFLSYKLNFKQRSVQLQAQFRFAFPQHLPPSKVAIQKIF